MDELERLLLDIKWGKVLADANPDIPNRCDSCGAYRIDGKLPTLHYSECVNSLAMPPDIPR